MYRLFWIDSPAKSSHGSTDMIGSASFGPIGPNNKPMVTLIKAKTVLSVND
jgi:hypothetical protein